MGQLATLLQSKDLSGGQELNLRLLLQSLDDPAVIAEFLPDRDCCAAKAAEVEAKAFAVLKTLVVRAFRHSIKKTSALVAGLDEDHPAAAAASEPAVRDEETRLLFTMLTQYLLCGLPQEAWDDDGDDEEREGVGASSPLPPPPPSQRPSFYKAAWGVLGLMIELSRDLLDRARYALKCGMDSAGQVLSYLADPTVSCLLNVTLLAFCLAPLSDLKQLLPDLVSLQKSSGNLEEIFAALESPGGVDLRVFRGVHELLTFVVSRSLGKIMNQVPLGDRELHRRFEHLRLLDNGLRKKTAPERLLADLTLATANDQKGRKEDRTALNRHH